MEHGLCEERGVANTFDALVWWVDSGEKRDQGKNDGPYRKLKSGFFFWGGGGRSLNAYCASLHQQLEQRVISQPFTVCSHPESEGESALLSGREMLTGETE